MQYAIASLLLLACARFVVLAALQYLNKSSLTARIKIYDVEISLKQKKREDVFILLNSVFDIPFILLFFWLGLFDLNPLFKAVNLLYLSLGWVFLVEPIYYVFHRHILHMPQIFSAHHQKHHLSHVTRPSTAFTFTLVERFSYTVLFAIPPVIASAIGHMDMVSMFIYILVIDIVNAAGHCNFEIFPRWYYRSWLWLFLYTPTFHSRHHTAFNKNFSLFMPIWDAVFSTTSTKTEELLRRARGGEPRTSLLPERSPIHVQH